MDSSVYRKVMLMVTELHVRGYQLLRISPGMAPSGCYWRCSIAPVNNFSKENGAIIVKHNDLIAYYSSGMERNYFGWEDAGYLTPGKLANIFIERFPKIAEAGKGSDWLYAGWYLEMLHLTYPDAFPVAYDDYWRSTDHLKLINGRKDIKIPIPPPGLG